MKTEDKTDHTKIKYYTAELIAEPDHTKTAMTVSSIIAIITWLISIVSWFLQGDMPLELLKYTSILYCAFFACYCCKAGYETYCKYKYETKQGIE